MRRFTSLADIAPSRGVGRVAAAPPAAPVAAARRRRAVVAAAHHVVRRALRRRLEVDRHGPRASDQHDGVLHAGLDALEILLELVLRRLVGRDEVERLRLDRAVGAWRPRQHFELELVLDRRDDRADGDVVGPSRPGEVPRLETAVREAPGRHLLDRPLAGGLEVGRARQPRPVHVRQVVHRPEDLRVVLRFLADLRVDVGVDALFFARRKGGAADATRADTPTAIVSVLCFMKAPEKRCWDYTCSVTLPLSCRLASTARRPSRSRRSERSRSTSMATHDRAPSRRRRRRRSPAIASSRSIPHDRQAFTQGLQYLDGVLYEGTGQHGQSGIRKVKLETGEVLQHQPLDAKYFGEGITVWGDTHRPAHVAGRDRIRLRQGDLQADRRPSAIRAKAGA